MPPDLWANFRLHSISLTDRLTKPPSHPWFPTSELHRCYRKQNNIAIMLTSTFTAVLPRQPLSLSLYTSCTPTGGPWPSVPFTHCHHHPKLHTFTNCKLILHTLPSAVGGCFSWASGLRCLNPNFSKMRSYVLLHAVAAALSPFRQYIQTYCRMEVVCSSLSWHSGLSRTKIVRTHFVFDSALLLRDVISPTFIPSPTHLRRLLMIYCVF